MINTYIASPFFDENSKAWVKAKEDDFKGSKLPYYSPREDGLNFNEEGLTKELRKQRILRIFENNVNNLASSDYLVANLNFCNGRVDIGTLWEVGYWLATNKHSTHLYYDCAPELRPRIETLLANLINIDFSGNSADTKTEWKLVRTKQINSEGEKLLEDSIKLSNFNLTIEYFNNDLSEITINDKYNYIFITDDFPMEIFLLLGYMYAYNRDYYTSSIVGYGSNIMIAASSKGHIIIPTFIDYTTNKNLL